MTADYCEACPFAGCDCRYQPDLDSTETEKP
jgi:hypothetical protein